MLEFKDYFDEKKCYIAQLIKMANADEQLNMAENMWLNFVTVSMGITPGDLNEISQNLEKFHFSAPLDEKERFFMFFRMIQLMKVDLNINQKELELCREMGLKLHITGEKVDKVLAYVKENERKLITFDDVCALIK
ncbi:MAG: hypothetical protein JEZ14_04960 [Marinilabiliaceae bacterium]|nr:hypothetical protein [Marinilabiliaceae bacterium]